MVEHFGYIMNKKIKEFAFECARELDWDPPTEPKTYTFTEAGIEKFAELIVAECCSKLAEMGDGWHEFSRNPPRDQIHNASSALFAAYRLKEDAVWELKEHFGVRE